MYETNLQVIVLVLCVFFSESSTVMTVLVVGSWSKVDACPEAPKPVAGCRLFGVEDVLGDLGGSTSCNALT